MPPVHPTAPHLPLSPAGYTHLLKTDDDCYVRIDQVLSALRQPVVLSPSAMAAEQGGQPRTPQPSAVRPRRLPAMHAQLLEMMGRDDGRDVLYTDGIQLYNATTLVRTAGTAAGAGAWQGWGCGGGGGGGRN